MVFATSRGQDPVKRNGWSFLARVGEDMKYCEGWIRNDGVSVFFSFVSSNPPLSEATRRDDGVPKWVFQFYSSAR